ncbi:MAG: flagellar brake protein [Chromatocurvus sp.]
MDDTGISDQEQIATLINSVQRHQFAVHLLAITSSAPEPSLLLAGDPQRRQLVFDAPRDLESGLYEPGAVMTVMTSCNGAELRFDTEVIDTEVFKGYPALRTSWPNRVISRQRRKAFRVRIGEDRSSRLELFDDAGNRIRGRLIDLSLTGFGALIDRTAPLRTGEEIDSSLEIDGVSLATTIQLSDLRMPDKGRFMRIGAAFIDLRPQQQSQLERLIRALERHAIRAEVVARS